MATLDHYLQVAAAALVLMEAPTAAISCMEALLLKGRVLRTPPARPWNAFFSRQRQFGSLEPWTLGALSKL